MHEVSLPIVVTARQLNSYETCVKWRHEPRAAVSERHKGRGRVAPPLTLSRHSPLLPDEPAGHQATGHQQSARAKREQRRSTATTGLRKLLRRRRRSRGRSLGRRRRSLGRLGLTRSLGNHASSLGDYVAVLTLGLGGGTTGLGLLGLGIGHDRWLVLGEGGRSGQHGHRQHRRQHHQLPQLTYLLLLESLFPSEADPLRERIHLLPKELSLFYYAASVRLAGGRRSLVDLLVTGDRVR